MLTGTRNIVRYKSKKTVNEIDVVAWLWWWWFDEVKCVVVMSTYIEKIVQFIRI